MDQHYIYHPYLSTIEANIIRRKVEGNITHITTDHTIFIPQDPFGYPGDIGTINGLKVLKVIESKGEIVHTVSGKFDKSALSMSIDMTHRLRLMRYQCARYLVYYFVELYYRLSIQSFTLTDESGVCILVNADPFIDTVQMEKRLNASLANAVAAGIDIAIEKRGENPYVVIDSLYHGPYLGPTVSNTAYISIPSVRINTPDPSTLTLTITFTD